MAPSFRIPELDTEGWSPILLKRWRLRGHPQETTENSVDLGHFTEIHGYTSVEVIRDAETVGPYLTATYAMTRRPPIPGRPIRTQFDVHVHGLGYSHVDISVERYGMRGRLFVLSTPIDGQEIELRIGVSIHKDTARQRAGQLLGLVPRAVFNRLLAYATFRGIVADVEQDFEIWKHKRYVQPPILAQGDGPVGRYRLWARQFYTEAEVGSV
jgi:hypothetical protein